jgi:hypothetical protein
MKAHLREGEVMNLNGKQTSAVDLVVFEENQKKIDPQDLVPYAGRWVAFSGDGTHVVESAEEIEDLGRKLEAAGIDASTIVWARIPGLDGI